MSALAMFSGESGIGSGDRIEAGRPRPRFGTRFRFLDRFRFRAGSVFPCFPDAVEKVPRGAVRCGRFRSVFRFTIRG